MLWGCGLTEFNSSHTYIPLFHPSHCCVCHSPVSCDLINFCLYKYVLQESSYIFWFCFAAVHDPKGSPTLHAAPLQCNSTKHPCKRVSSDHKVCYIGSCFWQHHTWRTFQFIMRSHDLIIKRARRYSNCRYYCWTGKLKLHRNWISHTIATHYTVDS